jgi:hypothetical protein
MTTASGEVLARAGQGFVPIRFAADLFGRPTRSVRSWIDAGAVASESAAGLRLVRLADVARESAARNRRRRRKTP